MQVFSKEWFNLHQKRINWCLNNRYTKRFFRWSLRIRKHDCPLDTFINCIRPSSFTYGAKKVGDRIGLTTDYRTHDKFAKRLYYAFRPIWWTMHFFDWLILDRKFPQYSLGFDTLTVYTQPSGGDPGVDGYTDRWPPNETFEDARAGAGSFANHVAPSPQLAYLQAGTLTDKYTIFRRSHLCYPTAALTEAANISDATLSIFGKATTQTGLGAITVHLAASTISSTTVLVASDYSQIERTSFGSKASASWSVSAYNDMALNASGIANISKTAFSKFSAQMEWDLLDDTTGLVWASSAQSSLTCYLADQAGTANDPKLVITYTLGAEGAGEVMVGIPF